MPSPWGARGRFVERGEGRHMAWNQREGKSPSGECKLVGVALSLSQIGRPSGKSLRETAVVLGDGTLRLEDDEAFFRISLRTL